MTTDSVRTFIRGRFEDGPTDGAETEPVFDPATGETIAVLPHSSADEIDRAVRAAADAFPGWADAPVTDRTAVMYRFKQVLEDHFEELSKLVTRENGKTLAEAKGEVRRGIEVVEVACGAPSLLMGQTLDQIADGIDEELVRFPVGVVAGITPFNF